MASGQKPGEDKVGGGGSNNNDKKKKKKNKNKKEVEVEVEVEKDLVPKMASHYETLAEKAKDPPTPGGKDVKVEDETKDDNREKSSGEESPQKQGKNRGSAGKAKGGDKEDALDRAREKVSSVKDTAKEVAGKTLGSAKDAVMGITERTKELLIGKTEEETRDRQEEEVQEEENDRADGAHAQEGKIGGILGAVGEALVEIAVSTKDLVFGKGKSDLWEAEDNNVVYDLGYGGRGEQRQQHEH
ncbi:hypothetical protein MLD38_009185 [Melastoma candidum]|uniref:Uncharacterized protein n=1 Tax=Melastoma candidum TaxID=119954 RepID=A0ACB9RWP7_9MYRT|nr:hypothetical protein MLD38_009185 [Melastoma candidum]